MKKNILISLLLVIFNLIPSVNASLNSDKEKTKEFLLETKSKINDFVKNAEEKWIEVSDDKVRQIKNTIAKNYIKINSVDSKTELNALKAATLKKLY